MYRILRMASTIRFSALYDRIRVNHPDHHAILKGIAWVSLFVILGKLAGAAKEMSVAYRYGVSSAVDSYLFIYNFLTWPMGVLFAVLTATLVPLAIRIQQESVDDLRRFRAELLGTTLIGSLILTAGAWFFMSMVLHSSWSGLNRNTAAEATNMLPVQIALLPLGLLISLFSAWTLAAGRHANTLLEAVPAVVIVAVILLIPSRDSSILSWATVAGFACHAICLIAPFVRRDEIERPLFSRSSRHWSAFWQGFGILFLGQAMITLITFVDVFFAAHLGQGAVSVLGYANRILSLMLGLGATVAIRAFLPVFSQARMRSVSERRRLVSRWVGILFLAGLVVVIVGILTSPLLVRLLFERGAFSAEDTLQVTEVLRYGFTQFPFYFGSLVLASYASSQGWHKTLFLSGLVALVSKFVINAALIPVLGVKGIALGWIGTYALTAFLFCVAVKREK